jgi:predicted O-methyltransferase YrrM
LSLLAYGFNRLYCNALNQRKNGITHFLLLHADVIPADPKTWVTTMMEEMERVGADILSAVVPLKGPTGLTSTALDKACLENKWAVQRLSMTEIMSRPETFTDPALLINTGCLLIDIRTSWAGEMCFTIKDMIAVNLDGEFSAQVESEDWGFSRRARQYGAKIWATRKLKLTHIGRAEFTNWDVWGEETDPLWTSCLPVLVQEAMKIDGWMSRKELEWLYGQAVSKDTIIEVGSWKGRSSKVLSACNKRLICIDTWTCPHPQYKGEGKEAKEEFSKNLRDEIADGKVEVLEGKSANALKHLRMFRGVSPDMIFIDGDHTYEGAKADIEQALKILPKGSLLCGHDYARTDPGVVQAVDELVPDRQIHDTIWWKII